MDEEETEYSYPPVEALSEERLLALGIQIVAPSKRRPATVRLYAAPLSDEAIARCRAKARKAGGS